MGNLSLDRQFVFKKVGIASDHAGKSLKKMILDFAQHLEVEVVDYGISSDEDKAVDYPDYAKLIANDIGRQKISGAIAICGTGMGMAMTANKFPGIRAVCPWDEYSCRMGRQHNKANVLCLGARSLNYHRAVDLVNIWLSTPFIGEQHTMRIEKLGQIEKKLFKDSDSH